MDFTKEEKKVLEKIAEDKKNEGISYRSFRVYRTASLWQELIVAASVIGAIILYSSWLSDFKYGMVFFVAIIVLISIVEDIPSSKRNRIKDSIIKKYRKENKKRRSNP